MVEEIIETEQERPEYNNTETVLLGLMICDNKTIPVVEADIKTDHFSTDTHKQIFTKIVSCYQKLRSVDLIILKDNVSKEELDTLGGIDYLRSLIAGVPLDASASAYIQALKDKLTKRRLKEGADEVLFAIESGRPLDYLVSLAASLGKKVKQEEASNIEVVSTATMKELEATRTQGVDLTVGLRQVDEALGGVRRKQLYTIGGKTSQGKTTFASNLIWHNLNENPSCRILYNGFENIDQVPIRLAAVDSGVKLEHFLKPHLISEEDYSKVIVSLGDLAKWKDRLKIISCGDINKLRSAMISFRPDITIVDYVQRLGYKYSTSGDGSIRHAVAKATSDLQDLGLEYNSAMFCLSQFSRSSEERREAPPEIENLKESGDIENYSDVIILLYWPWRISFADRYRKDDYRLLIRKNKLGPCVDAMVRLNLDTLKLSDWGASDERES